MKRDVGIAKKKGKKVPKAEVAKMLKQELKNQQPVVTQAQIDKLNSKKLGWKAGKDKLNAHMTVEEYHDGLGLETPKDGDLEDEPAELKKVVVSKDSVMLLGL